MISIPFIRLASLLILLLLTTCEFSKTKTTCEALEILPPKVHIRILNDLLNTMVMNIHCHSGLGDFGVHAVPKLGVYEFDYQSTGLRGSSSTASCSMEWGGQTHYFDIYDNNRDEGKCTECSWDLNEEGACRWVDWISKQCYPWN